MDLRTITNTIRRRGRNYLYRLNNGAVPRPLPPEHLHRPGPDRDRPIVNIILFVLTFMTTTVVGATGGNTLPDTLVSGLPYSVTLLTILLSHEFGHYMAARRFRVDATLPFFIPIPFAFGTMGAIIKMRSPVPHRRALLYIGMMGPLTGFVLSLAAVTVGISLSTIGPLPAGGSELGIPVFGDSLLFAFLVRVIHGSIPQGQGIILSSYAWAGWIGFLVTSLNLMPIGQLDGSHILYALIGRKQAAVGWAAFAGLIAMSFIWPGWIVWIVLTLALLMVAHPEVPEIEALNAGEKMLGWFCVLILILTFIPIPVTLV